MPRGIPLLCLAAAGLSCLPVLPAFAAPALQPIRFAAENAGGGTIVCTATIAHWFSVDLGRAGPGEAVEATLWSEPQSGVIFVLNERGDRLPVETLWCGMAGRSWATRAPIPLDGGSGSAPPPIAIACAPEGSRLVCR